MQLTVYELYRRLRAKLELLSIEDVLTVSWAYSCYLQIRGFNFPSEIEVSKDFLQQRMPSSWVSEWHLEFLCKEVILNGGNIAGRRRTLRLWKNLVNTISEIKNFEQEVYRLYGTSEKITEELSRIAHQQFPWQENRPDSSSWMRYLKIFNTPQINKICVARTGIEVETAFLCGMALMSVFLDQPKLALPIQSEIRALDAKTVDKFLTICMRTQSELRTLIEDNQVYDYSFIYSFNLLRKFPLVRMMGREGEFVVCPVPTLLFWRITGGLYYELINDPTFSHEFGHSFQRYIGSVATAVCRSGRVQLLAERRYGSKKKPRDSVDWIICDDKAAVFLECKTIRLSWKAKVAVSDPDLAQPSIDILADAVVQNYRNVLEYLEGRFPHFPLDERRTIYPVIVTLENWYLFGGQAVERLKKSVLEKLLASHIDVGIVDAVPYAVMSVLDFEYAIQIIESTGVSELLSGKLGDIERKNWDWRGYMGEAFQGRVQRKKIFDDEYAAIMSRLIEREERASESAAT